MKGFKAKYVFDGTAMLEDKVVLVDNDRIVDVVSASAVIPDVTVIDYGDGVIAPGLIDLQLNGCGGALFNDEINAATLETMYQTWRKFGSTGFLPTLITSDFGDVITALEVVKDWFSRYANRRGVLGIHLEGPFISKNKSGIHPKEYIIRPTMHMLEQIVAYTKYFPVKMTIAVEEFSEDQIEFLARNNVILSIGHCNANYAQAKRICLML